MQLRHKFFIASSLLTTVPLLILQFGVVERMEHEVQSRTEHELHGTLDKMSDELELILNNQKSIANGLARVPAVRNFANLVVASDQNRIKNKYQRSADDLESFFLNYQHSVPSIQALRFIDTSGKTLVKVKEGKPIPAKRPDLVNNRTYVADQSPKRFFKDAIKSAHQGNVVMSDFELGQVTIGADFCPAMVRYSVPVRDELDQLQGLLVVNIWGTRLDSTVKSALGGYSAKTYIVELNKDLNRDGIYLYHPDNQKRFANQLNTNFRFSNELEVGEWDKIHNRENNGTVYKSDGRMLYYQVMSPFKTKEKRWLLVIETDSDVVFESINNMRRSIWLLLGSLMIVSLLVAVWASGRLTGPVHRLAEIIKTFADGERGARYQGPVNDEVGLAGKAFNYLATTLEQTEQEREKAVRSACQSERLAALGQMAAGIGHEINNPLMNIMSLASLIEETLDDSNTEAKNDIKILRKEGERCARIIQGILNFARVNEPSYKVFDFSELIEETLELLHHRIETSNIRLVTNLDSSLFMEGDSGMLQQVLVNILLNAIQASPADAEISISAKQRENNLVIEILDQGSGVDAKNFSKLFDPFFTTKKEGEGTGLGLSVSYGIIKHHGGTISLENMDDIGVKVSIILPAKNNENADEVSYLEVGNAG